MTPQQYGIYEYIGEIGESILVFHSYVEIAPLFSLHHVFRDENEKKNSLKRKEEEQNLTALHI